MAKFIAIHVTNTGLTAGTRLINADQIVTVTQTAATTTTIQMAPASGATTDVFTLTHTSTGTTPSVMEAVNAALIAVPGGQVVHVDFPEGVVCSAIALA